MGLVYRSSCWRAPGVKIAACQATILLIVAFTFPLSCAIAGSTGFQSAFGADALGGVRLSVSSSMAPVSSLYGGFDLPNSRLLIVQVHAAILVLGVACWTAWHSPTCLESMARHVIPPPPSVKTRRARDTSTFSCVVVSTDTSGASLEFDASSSSPLDYSA